MRWNLPTRFSRRKLNDSKRARRARGQATVEFVIVFPIVFMLIWWIFELGWVMYTCSVMADAANEGVRYAMVHSGGDPSGTEARVKTFAAASLHSTSAISVSVTDPDGSYDPPNRVRVTVSYSYVPWLSSVFTFFSATPPTINSFAEGRMVSQ